MKTAEKSNLTSLRVHAAPESWSKYTTSVYIFWISKVSHHFNSIFLKSLLRVERMALRYQCATVLPLPCWSLSILSTSVQFSLMAFFLPSSGISPCGWSNPNGFALWWKILSYYCVNQGSPHFWVLAVTSNENHWIIPNQLFIPIKRTSDLFIPSLKSPLLQWSLPFFIESTLGNVFVYKAGAVAYFVFT